LTKQTNKKISILAKANPKPYHRVIPMNQTFVNVSLTQVKQRKAHEGGIEKPIIAIGAIKPLSNKTIYNQN